MTLQEEARKRAGWAWENSLRSHNFVGFIHEILENVTADKLKKGDAEYDKWIDGAKAATKARRAKSKDAE
jgi:ubiquitin carboxyl-terminal hydrolase L5